MAAYYFLSHFLTNTRAVTQRKRTLLLAYTQLYSF